MTHVLITGASTRAAAASAARAGFTVTSLDAFGDLDQHPSVQVVSMRRDLGMPFTAGAAARTSREVTCDAVVYLSSFENHPGAVATLAADRALWGNSPAVLRSVRNPFAVSAALRGRGLAVPRVRQNANGLTQDADAARWLLKPRRSGGGHRVRRWTADMRIPRDAVLQELIDGIAGSIVFVAANGRAVPVGLTQQLVGEAAFGVSGYRYCGNIVSTAAALFGDAGVLAAATTIVDTLAQEFALVGVNGVDFIASGAAVLPIEVNPRWCSSMELVERVYGVSMFAAHAAACVDAATPDFDLPTARAHAAAAGKAIVFARRSITVGDTRGWLDNLDIRDVPHPGERIGAGQPICTVLADAASVPACRDALTQRARSVYAQVDAWQEAA